MSACIQVWFDTTVSLSRCTCCTQPNECTCRINGYSSLRDSILAGAGRHHVACELNQASTVRLATYEMSSLFPLVTAARPPGRPSHRQRLLHEPHGSQTIHAESWSRFLVPRNPWLFRVGNGRIGHISGVSVLGLA